jgi:hypothetical protein
MHNFVPPPDPVWGDFCWEKTDEDGYSGIDALCGWTEEDHYDFKDYGPRGPYSDEPYLD